MRNIKNISFHFYPKMANAMTFGDNCKTFTNAEYTFLTKIENISFEYEPKTCHE